MGVPRRIPAARQPEPDRAARHLRPAKSPPVCDACARQSDSPVKRRRRRLWEINPGWHCSIVGTCLTLGELRVLARKLGFRGGETRDADYVLHGAFVQQAGNRSHAAKMMNKLLDRKHAATIRRFQRCTSTQALAEAWDQAFQAGDIPGPFWAVRSHPDLDDRLGTCIYGDVHMLSHLVGGSNRADIAALRHMEEAIATIEERREKAHRRHEKRIGERDSEIGALRGEIADLRTRLAQAEEKPVQPKIGRTAKPESAAREIAGLRQELAAAAAGIDRLQQTNRRLESALPLLQAEIRALELSIMPDGSEALEARCPFDLNGRCILYVGGRAPHVCRLRALVETWNGELMHHDGGIEKSIDDLARAVVKADTVVFPTDCVSHGAVLEVKRLCRQSMKPFIPLRTSGVASFVAGLRTGLEESSHWKGTLSA